MSQPVDRAPSVRAARFLADVVREVDAGARVASVGDVDDGYFLVLARRTRLAGGCTLESMTVARAIAGDRDALETIVAAVRHCLDRSAA